MSKKFLYEYAIVHNPQFTKEGEESASTILIPVTQILASNDREASIVATRAIPDDYVGKIDQVDVLVRRWVG